MNQEIELVACPNCGEDAPNAPEMSKVYNGVVICPECGMSGYIEYWQHRPIEDTLREENKKLKEALEMLRDHCEELWGVIGADEGYDYLENWYEADPRGKHAEIKTKVEEALK